ncbi:hypothetical protein HELRODRAFT_194814 [Helobdella robusta]|uniref:Uncharacterized protein n=1 Tax=Helobdella robusta TaxID=6412 RepID=T1FWG1_HELRO|nr:hypothetical protein HELRODRAFT_194814 [Helobdella robusta]ESO11428.1 hypothetical protein HELRODRAFT_194814 [Helobdella robusta]
MAPSNENALIRDLDDLKAEIVDALDKKYEQFKMAEIDNEAFEEKIVQLLSAIQNLCSQRKSIEPAGQSQSGSLKLAQSVKTLQSCRYLLNLDELLKQMNKNFSKSFLKEVFNLLEGSLKAKKALPVVSAIMLRGTEILSRVTRRYKMMFFECIHWEKSPVELKWRVKVDKASVNQQTWIEALKTLEKLNQLEPLLTQLFDDLMTYFVDPILNLNKNLTSDLVNDEVVVRIDPISTRDPNSETTLFMRVRVLTNLLFIALKMTHTPEFSLVERFGSNGRACKLFETIIGHLDSKSGQVEGYALKEVKGQLNLAKTKGFISEADLKKMLVKLDVKIVPNEYDRMLAKCQEVIKCRLPNSISVGVKNDVGDDVTMGKPIWEAVEECLHEDLRFPECSVRQNFKLPCGLSYYDVIVSLDGQATSCLMEFTLSKARWMDSCWGETDLRFDPNYDPTFLEKFTSTVKIVDSVSKIWASVLHKDIYLKSLGALCNSMVQIITDRFLTIATNNNKDISNIDINKDDDNNNSNKLKQQPNIELIKFFHSSLQSLETFVTSLFSDDKKVSPDGLVKLAPKMKKLEEMRFILEPFCSPRGVINKWGAKKEPNNINGILSKEELRVLIELVFHGADREKLLYTFC